MADDGRTTLGELARGDVFRTADGLLWVRCWSGADSNGGCWCQPLDSPGPNLLTPGGTQVEGLDLPALLSELAELRTLAHDLLLDRDAAYGREVGRGEALAAVGSLLPTGGPVSERVEALITAESVIRTLGPVRPLPPPERLAARCRALGDALRDLVAGHLNEMTARGLPHEWAPDSPMGRAVRLLEEISAGK
jgi:hypothetical protein